MLETLIPIVFTVSLAMLVFGVGLDATLDDVLYLFKRPLLLLKAVISVNVVVPVVALLLVPMFPLTPVAKAGIVLMAVSPVPPLVPGNEMKAGARKAYAYGLYVALIILAVAIVPATVALLDAIYGVSIVANPLDVARNVVLTVLLPLAIGLAVRWRLPVFAERASPLVGKLAMLLLAVAFIPMLIGVWPAMAALVGNGTIMVMVLMSLAALLAGHLLGGPDLDDRAALAVTSAIRHPGLALMIAGATFEDKRVTAAILMVTLIGVVLVTPYRLWVNHRRAGRLPGPVPGTG